MPTPSPLSDRGERGAALDGLLGELEGVRGGNGDDDLPEDAPDLLRQAIVGILSEDPADPSARDYRRKLAAALP